MTPPRHATPAALPRFDASLPALAPSWSGRVVAGHATSAVARAGDGTLVTLLHPSRDLVPWGVAVPWDPAPSAGEAVCLQGRDLAIGPARWRLDGPGVDLGVRPDGLDAGTLAAHAAALGPPGTGPVPAAANRLAAWLLGGDGDAGACVAALAGLGPGSTPSGDDALAGLAAATARRATALAPARVAAFRAALAGVDGNVTTETGCAMLRHAADGRFPEALARLAGLAGDPAATPGAVREAAARLVARTGASSGADMLEGVRALVGRPVPGPPRG